MDSLRLLGILYRRFTGKIALARINRYPVKELTWGELCRMRIWSSFNKEDMQTCLLGTWVVCRKDVRVPSVIIVAQVVVSGFEVRLRKNIVFSKRGRKIQYYRAHILDNGR